MMNWLVLLLVVCRSECNGECVVWCGSGCGIEWNVNTVMGGRGVQRCGKSVRLAGCLDT